MIKHAESLHYTPEAELENAGIRKVGVGLLIVDLDTTNVWVIEENVDKNGPEGTGRKAVKWSIPLETRKPGESIIDNVLGGLAEFRKLTDREELVWKDNESYISRSMLIKGVAVDFVIIGLRNHTDNHNGTVNSQEVTPIGWMGIKELRSVDNLKAGVDKLLDLAISNNVIENFIEAARNSSSRERTLDASTDLLQLFEQREVLNDITFTNAYATKEPEKIESYYDDEQKRDASLASVVSTILEQALVSEKAISVWDEIVYNPSMPFRVFNALADLQRDGAMGGWDTTLLNQLSDVTLAYGVLAQESFSSQEAWLFGEQPLIPEEETEIYLEDHHMQILKQICEQTGIDFDSLENSFRVGPGTSYQLARNARVLMNQ